MKKSIQILSSTHIRQINSLKLSINRNMSTNHISMMNRFLISNLTINYNN